MTTPLAVWPRRSIAGWNGNGPLPAGVDISPCGATALFSMHGTDAHCCGYITPGETKQPRLNMACLSALPVEPEMRWAFLDVDLPGHAEWPDDLTAEITLDAVLDLLPEAGGYTTKHGYRIVWSLRDPVPVRLWGSFWDQLAAYVLAVTGVEVDPFCRDWTRCYRLPNVDRDGTGSPQFAVAWRDPGELTWKPPGALIQDAPSHSAPRSNDPLPAATGPVPLDLPLLDRIGATLAGKIRAGRSLAAPGARDVTMTKAIGALLNAMPEPEALPVFRLLRPSVEAMGDPSVDKLWDRCQHFAAMKGAERAEANDLKARIQEAAEDLPLVLVGDGQRRYFVLSPMDRSYLGPYASDMLPRQLLSLIVPSYPGLRIVAEKSGAPLPTNQLLINTSAYQLDSIVWRMGAERTTYEHDKKKLIRPCAQVKAEAAYHEDVAQWLMQLGADHHGALLDWCATITELDVPTCALYLDGLPGIGKSMFAAAVAQVYGANATTYAQATGDWNAPLRTCPIVVADEGLPAKVQQFSADLRSLVSERARPLTQKYVGDASIEGCPRLIITANNPDALRLLNETLTAADIEGISKRILYIKCGGAPPIYTDGWVTAPDGSPGKIPQMMMWLKENRPVTRGNRFLVEGVKVEWHDNLSRASGATGDVLAVLAYHLERGRYNPGIVTGDITGDVLVYPRAVRDLWPQMLPGEKTPGDRVISRTVSTLSTGKCKRKLQIGQKWLYRVPLSQIMAEAKARLIGLPKDLEAAAKRPHNPTAGKQTQGAQ